MLGDRTFNDQTPPVPIDSASINAIYKEQLASQFGNAAAHYDSYAVVQSECAADLVSLLLEADLPEGRVLEIGCGTGFVTKALVNSFPNRSLEITDLSQEMVDYCRTMLAPLAHHPLSISFRQLDGEQVEPEELYSAIASGFVVQWFEDVVQGLERLGRSLRPGGKLVASFPTCHSFPEWKQICEEANLPFTGNPMPDVDFLCQQLSRPPFECRYHTRWLSTTYERAIDFFKGLKLIGAGLQRSDLASFRPSPSSLSPPQLRQLVSTWDTASPGHIQVTYHIAFLIIQRH